MVVVLVECLAGLTVGRWVDRQVAGTAESLVGSMVALKDMRKVALDTKTVEKMGLR
jgi:hypothetical protein